MRDFIENWRKENNLTFNFSVDAIQVIGENFKQQILDNPELVAMSEKYISKAIIYYEMSLWFNCTENGKPGFLIEYSDSYGDGNYGNIDFISSNEKNGNRIQFLLDNKDYGDPFAKGGDKLGAFKIALKKAYKLTLSVYGKEFNPQTGKDEEKLNRSIEFKTEHGELLDRPVNCGK